ncbi:MAG: DUF2239 family protein [Gemmatimonadaceae bacterium]|jgi:hypothetical protein|nr:DUF2239 family protein [Gemmatimonadaceae bacterium]
MNPDTITDDAVEAELTRPSTAFADTTILVRGPLRTVAHEARRRVAAGDTRNIVVTDDATGAPIELHLDTSEAELALRLLARARADVASRSARALDGRRDPSRVATATTKGRGRPRLGVVPREVTLLPRHWAWLSAQRGGASAALRRLVDDARRADDGSAAAREATQQAAYTFMRDMAGDSPGFEEALRALFAGDLDRMAAHMAAWPADVRAHALRLARGSESP